MTLEEKKSIIADILEKDVEDIHEDSLLADFEAWDSIAVLSVISEVERATGKYLHASEIKKLKTIDDLLELFGA